MWATTVQLRASGIIAIFYRYMETVIILSEDQREQRFRGTYIGVIRYFLS